MPPGQLLISIFRSFPLIVLLFSIVFESRKEAVGWDGTFHGVPQEIGTYYYSIKYKCANEEYFEEKSDFFLIR